jgi:hypothetical protein
MKYKTILQVQSNAGGTWYYHQGTGWNFTVYDNFGQYTFPEPDTVGSGRRLHVRFDKPQGPSAVVINAYPRVGEKGYPSGQSRQLKRTIRSVKQGGETVGCVLLDQPVREALLPGSKIGVGAGARHAHQLRGVHRVRVARQDALRKVGPPLIPQTLDATRSNF